jgi:hypothetical protein
MPKQPWTPAIKDDIRGKTKTHTEYRQKVDPYPSKDPDVEVVRPEQTWRGSWPRSAEFFFCFVEQLVFGKEFLPMLKSAVKNRKSAEEMMDYVACKERLDQIVAALDEEDISKPEMSDKSGKQLDNGDHDDFAKPEKLVVTDNSTEDQLEFKKIWKTYALKIIDSRTPMIAETLTEGQLVQALDAFPWLSQLVGTKGVDYVHLMWIMELSAEPVTAPHVRKVPFKEDRLIKIVKAFLTVRKKAYEDPHTGEMPDGIAPGDLFLCTDGKKPGYVSKNKLTCVGKSEGFMYKIIIILCCTMLYYI